MMAVLRTREERLAAGAAAAAAGAAGAAIAGRRAGLFGADGDRAADQDRSYRLKRKEPVAAGVRRIALGRIDDAVEHLRGEGDPVEAVHEARKDTKKLRSLLRLVRPALGDEIYRRENERFRDAARLLSDIRDAQVRLQTLDALTERFADEVTRSTFASFRTALESDVREQGAADPRPAMGSAAAAIEAGRERVGEWPLEAGEWAMLGGGLRRQYARGRDAYRAAADDPSAEALHEWRKRVKDHWYHQRLLRNMWRETLEPSAEVTHELADRLGDDHDLVLLGEHAADRPAAFDDPDEQLALRELIDRRRAELQAEAFDLGARVYAEKPGALARRYEALFDAWR
jgi:CHAD domain-containing protein